MPDPKKLDPDRPRRVEITEGTAIKGEHYEPRDVVEVSAADAVNIVGAGRGKFVADDAPLCRDGTKARAAREADATRRPAGRKPGAAAPLGEPPVEPTAA